MKKNRLMELAGLISESDLAAYAGIGTLDQAVKNKVAYKKFIEAIDILLDDWYAAGFTKDDIVDYMKGILPEGPGGIKEVDEVNPNQLASGLNPNREMEKEIVKKQARKEELMDMRVNMLRLMKSFKNLGFSEQEVAKYFEEEVKNKMKNTY